MSKYVDRVLAELKEKNAHEAEFLQTAEEVLSTLGPVVDAHPEYEKVALLERMVEPAGARSASSPPCGSSIWFR